MPITAPNCSPAPVCNSWEAAFCICNPDVSTIGLCNEPGAGTQHDTDSGLQGQYSKTASVAAQFGTGASWTNPDNALVEDGSYASLVVDPGVIASCFGTYTPGSQFLKLTGFGLSVPLTATVLGLVVAYKGHEAAGTGCGPGPASFAAQLYNLAFTHSGNLYYYADPSGDSNNDCYSPIAPYIDGQPVGEGYPGLCDPPNSNGCDKINDSVYVVLARGSRATNGWCSVESPPNDATNLENEGPGGKTFFTTPTKTLWTPSEVNDSSFGVALSFASTGRGFSPQIFLDAVGVGVYYTASAGPPPPTPVTSHALVYPWVT